MASNKRQRQKAGRDVRRQAALAASKRKRLKWNILTFFVVGLLVVGVFKVISGGGDDKSSSAASAGCPKTNGSSARKVDFTTSLPPQCISPDKKYTAAFNTTEGTFEASLDNTKLPNTVNNFVYLARFHYYDKTNVFRLADSIDIWQSGSPHTQSGTDTGPGYTINDEGSDFTYDTGDLAMARTQVSSSGQYFVGAGPEIANLNGPDTGQGQGKYLKFGKITKGLDVAQAIMALHPDTPPNEYDGPPNKAVTVRTVTIRESN